MARLQQKTVWCSCGKVKSGFTFEEGWWVCANCKCPRIMTMNECDICGVTFKGVQFIKIAFTCPRCENEMSLSSV